jgi:hypothetical protein
MNTLVRYYPDTDMRNGHDGLAEMARKSGIKIDNLGAGEFLAFVNRARNKLKLYNGQELVAYLRLKDNRKIDPRVIQNLPRYFDGTKINYDAAMRDSLMKYFPNYFSAGENVRKRDVDKERRI